MSDTPMTDARLDEIEKLTNAATPGPWPVVYDYDDRPDTGLSAKFPTGIGPFTWVEHPNVRDDVDAEFVAAARTAVPELVAEIQRLQAELADTRRARSIVTLTEAREIAHAEALRLEGHNLDYSRGARCVAYLLTRAIRTAEADRLRAQLAAKEA